MLKVIRDCIGFALVRSVIGQKLSRPLPNQSDAKLKPIATSPPAFSRALRRLHIFTLSSHWLLVIFIFVPIGRCDYFGFGYTTLDRKALYYCVAYAKCNPHMRASQGWGSCSLVPNKIFLVFPCSLKVFLRFWSFLFPKICFCSHVPSFIFLFFPYSPKN